MKRLIAAMLAVMFFAGSSFAEAMKIIVAVNGKNLYATLEDNPASRAMYEKMPFTVKMKNLYGRELCFNLPFALPEGRQTATNYEVGDIIYWPPRHSFIILYKQNGERFRRQHLGHIEAGVEMFSTAGDIDVTFVPAE